MKKKILTLSLALVIVVASTVGVTLAWLTSKTDVIVNKFTSGKVEITLKEETFEKDSNDAWKVKTALGNTTVSGYKIIPGGSQHKAPFVEIADGSEDCYVYIYVSNKYASGNLVKTSSANATVGYDSTNWEKISFTLANSDEENPQYALYRYKTVLSNSNDSTKKTAPLFDTVTYSSEIEAGDVSGDYIQFRAYAIQSAAITVSEADLQAVAYFSQEK